MSSNKTRPRARDLGAPFEGDPGPYNAITDIEGVAVGHTTLIAGAGPLIVGQGPVRTGVTAILPRNKDIDTPVMAAGFAFNGNGEMTGMAWVEESGFLEGPITLTNTHSVGLVRDSVIAWQMENTSTGQDWSLPVTAETYDGYLNDINGFHVRKEHVYEALNGAASGPVEEGSVGGGTGMICHDFKGGIGTSSRRLNVKGGSYTLGVLVQANHGLRRDFRVAGVPVGLEISEKPVRTRDQGSIIVIVATDAPLAPHQLKRVARRASLGLGRTGSFGANSSGDIFLAFSTAEAVRDPSTGLLHLTMLPNHRLDALFEATARATEEAIVNAIVAADDMTGRDDHTVMGLPHERLRAALAKYNRLDP